MANSSHKYLTKLFRFIFIAVLAALVLSLAVNAALFFMRDSLLSALDRFKPIEITAGPLVYVFPNTVVVKDIRVAGEKQEPVLTLTNLLLSVDLWELMRTRKVKLSQLTIGHAFADQRSLWRLLRRYRRELIAVYYSMPHGDLNLNIQDLVLYQMTEGGKDYDKIVLSLKTSVQGERLEAKGTLSKSPADPVSRGAGRERQSPTRTTIALTARIPPGHLEVEKVTLKNPFFHADLWGALQNEGFQFNGFFFFQHNPKDSGPDGRFAKLSHFFMQKMDAFFRRNIPQEKYYDLYVLDMDGVIRGDEHGVILDRMKCSVNNVPTRISGRVRYEQQTTFDLEVLFLPGRMQKDIESDFQKTVLKLSGFLSGSNLHGGGSLDILFGEPTEDPDDNQGARAKILDLTLRPQGDIFQLGVGRLAVSLRTQQSLHSMLFRDLRGSMNTFRDMTIVNLKSICYGGNLTGRTWINHAQSPAVINARAHLSEGNPQLMGDMLKHFSRFYGKLEGDMIFSNRPHMALTGTASIDNGYLKNLEFFNWMSETFSIPGLREVSYDRAKTDFRIEFKRTALDKIDIVSDDVLLRGHYRVGEGEMVSSRLSLGLSPAIIKESRKLAALLRDQQEKPQHWFEFQASGNIDAMNFQWLPSELKTHLQKKIPDFIERRIENIIDPERNPGKEPENEEQETDTSNK